MCGGLRRCRIPNAGPMIGVLGTRPAHMFFFCRPSCLLPRSLPTRQPTLSGGPGPGAWLPAICCPVPCLHTVWAKAGLQPTSRSDPTSMLPIRSCIRVRRCAHGIVHACVSAAPVCKGLARRAILPVRIAWLSIILLLAASWGGWRRSWCNWQLALETSIIALFSQLFHFWTKAFLG